MMYHTTVWTTAKSCFTSNRFLNISHSKLQRRNFENQIYSIFNPALDFDLEEGVNEKQHHESENGVLFGLQR